MKNFIKFKIAFWLGSMVTTFIQIWYSTRKDFKARQFAEKRDAFVGFLKAQSDVRVLYTRDTYMEFHYWRFRCDLVSSKEVRKAIHDILNPKGASLEEKERAYFTMVTTMRNDLGLTE